MKQQFEIIWDKNTLVLSQHVGFRIAIYNGFKFATILVKEDMVDRKFGEFIVTKRLGSKIHKMKLKKKKKR